MLPTSSNKWTTLTAEFTRGLTTDSAPVTNTTNWLLTAKPLLFFQLVTQATSLLTWPLHLENDDKQVVQVMPNFAKLMETLPTLTWLVQFVRERLTPETRQVNSVLYSPETLLNYALNTLVALTLAVHAP
jgi:hypothetical protein